MARRAATTRAPTPPSRPRALRRGWMITETAFALMLAVAGLGLLAVAEYQFAEVRRITARQEAVRIAAHNAICQFRAGLPVAPPAAHPDMSITVAQSPAADDWTGLTSVTITATLPGTRGRSAQTVLTAYIPPVERTP